MAVISSLAKGSVVANSEMYTRNHRKVLNMIMGIRLELADTIVSGH